MAADTVTAIWEGPFPMELPSTHPQGRRVIEPGTKVRDIPREQAEGSDYWRIEEKKPKGKDEGAEA